MAVSGHEGYAGGDAAAGTLALDADAGGIDVEFLRVIVEPG